MSPNRCVRLAECFSFCVVLVVTGVAHPGGTPTTEAEAVRRRAEEALGRIENGDGVPDRFEGRERKFCQSLAAARHVLWPGDGSPEQVRRITFLDDESKGFVKAYRAYLQSGDEDPTESMTGAEWVYFLLGLPLVHEDLVKDVDPAIRKPREEAFVRELRQQDAQKNPTRVDCLHALLVTLGQLERSKWPARVTAEKSPLSDILGRYLKAMPPVVPSDTRPVPQDAIDLDVVRRWRKIAQEEKSLEDYRGQLLLLALGSSVARGSNAADAARDSFEFVHRAASPKKSWEDAVLLVSRSKDLADVRPSEDRLRRARGVLLQAAAEPRLAPKEDRQQQALANNLQTYLDECRRRHPFGHYEWPLVKDAEACQAEVLAEALALADRGDHEYLDKLKPGARADLFRLAAAHWVTALGASPSPRFRQDLGRFRKAVESDGALAPVLLDALAWRPEFWDGAWGRSRLDEWKGMPGAELRREVEAMYRLASALRGLPAQGDVLAAVASKEELRKQRNDAELGKLIAREARENHRTFFRHAWAVCLEGDLVLRAPVEDPPGPLSPDGLKRRREERQRHELAVTELTDADLNNALKELPKLLGPAPGGRAGVLERAVREYAAVVLRGPCAGVPTGDGRPFYDVSTEDLRSHLGSLGASAAFGGTDGVWRRQGYTTLLWLALARGHERLGERHYYRAGFIFDLERDYQRSGVMASIRKARQHLLCAQLIYRSLCVPARGVQYPYADRPPEVGQVPLGLPVPSPTPVDRVLAGGRPLLREAIQAGLMRTRAQLARLESGLDASGHSGAVGKIDSWSGLVVHLDRLAGLMEKGVKAEAAQVRSALRVQEAELGADAADARVAAHGERLAGMRIALGQAELGLERARWNRNIFDVKLVGQHFAVESSRQHALASQAEAQKALVELNKARYEQFLARAQIEMLLASLPQYVVELQHARYASVEARKFLAELEEDINRRHKEWKDSKGKDIFGFITKMVTFVVDAVCACYGLPPLGSIVKSAAEGVIDFAEGRTAQGIARLTGAFEMAGGKELLEEGIGKLGQEINKWDWVKKAKKSDSGALALIRGFGESALPDDFTKLLALKPGDLAETMLAAGRDPEAAQGAVKNAIAQSRRNFSAVLGEDREKQGFLDAQAALARQRLYRGAVSLGAGAAGDLLGDDARFKKFLNKRLGVETGTKEEIVKKTLHGIKDDALRGVKESLTEIYRPFPDLQKKIAERSRKSEDELRGEFVAYLKKGKHLDDAQIEALVKDWRKNKDGLLAPVLPKLDKDAQGLLARLEAKVTSREFLDAMLKGELPGDVKDLTWFRSLADDLIRGSLGEEMMAIYHTLAAQGKNEELKLLGETLKAALVAVRASTDYSVAKQVTQQFQLVTERAEIKVCAAWEAELQELLAESYDEEDLAAKADIEGYWNRVKGEIKNVRLQGKTLEILKNPPRASLPKEAQDQMFEFDKAIGDVLAVSGWLMNSANYKEQIDQLVKIDEDADYDKARKDLVGTLGGELKKVTERLDRAIEIAGFPGPRPGFEEALKGPCEAWAKKTTRIPRLEAEKALLETEKEDLGKQLDSPFLKAQAEKRLAEVEGRLKAIPGEVEALRNEIPRAREAAMDAMAQKFGLIRPAKELTGLLAERAASGGKLPSEKEGRLDKLQFQQFEDTKKQVDAMLDRLEGGQGESGLFKEVTKRKVETYLHKFDEAAKDLEALEKEHRGMAYALAAAGARADFQAALFRKKKSEVEYAIAEKAVEIARVKVKEEEALLLAAQLEYQRARTHVDLARVDAWEYDQLTRGREEIDTPAFRQLLQRAAWRGARDAAFFARVYYGLDDVPAPPTGPYFSPGALRAFADRLGAVRAQLDYDRAVLFDLQDVSAVLTVNPDVLAKSGQKCTHRGLDFRRVRFQVRSYRGTAKGQPMLPRGPNTASPSWFIEEGDVSDWDALLNELSGSGLLEEVPTRTQTKAQRAELLRRLNRLLAGAPLRVPPADQLPPLSRAVLGDWLTGRQATLWERKGRWTLGEPPAVGGEQVMRNRLALEVRLPTGLRPASASRYPILVDASEGAQLERTALQQVVIFIRQGSVKDTARAQVLLRHLGDGWITTAGSEAGTPINWPPAPLDQIRPMSVRQGDWDEIDTDTTVFMDRYFKSIQRPKNQLVNHWSAFYPMMGTYEVLIPEEVAQGGSFEYKVLLRGCSVQMAREAAREAARREAQQKQGPGGDTR